MVHTQVAILALASCIHESILVFAGSGELGSAFGVVAVLAHAIGVVISIRMAAALDHFPMGIDFLLFLYFAVLGLGYHILRLVGLVVFRGQIFVSDFTVYCWQVSLL